MIKHSVRWKSDTHLVKVGKYWVQKVGITGDYLIRGGKLKGKNNNDDGKNSARNGAGPNV